MPSRGRIRSPKRSPDAMRHSCICGTRWSLSRPGPFRCGPRLLCWALATSVTHELLMDHFRHYPVTLLPPPPPPEQAPSQVAPCQPWPQMVLRPFSRSFIASPTCCGHWECCRPGVPVPYMPLTWDAVGAQGCDPLMTAHGAAQPLLLGHRYPEGLTDSITWDTGLVLHLPYALHPFSMHQTHLSSLQ